MLGHSTCPECIEGRLCPNSLSDYPESKNPMPRYEFSCRTCGQTFERVLPIEDDRSQVRCPAGHRDVHRIYSAPGVVFKGHGFYVTDHPSGSASSGKDSGT